MYATVQLLLKIYAAFLHLCAPFYHKVFKSYSENTKYSNYITRQNILTSDQFFLELLLQGKSHSWVDWESTWWTADQRPGEGTDIQPRGRHHRSNNNITTVEPPDEGRGSLMYRHRSGWKSTIRGAAIKVQARIGRCVGSSLSSYYQEENKEWRSLALKMT